MSLVWNSRNERSHNADKLQALSTVSLLDVVIPLACFIHFYHLYISHLQYLWRKGGPNSKFHLIHSVWANFQTSTNNVSQRTRFSYATAKYSEKFLSKSVPISFVRLLNIRL